MSTTLAYNFAHCWDEMFKGIDEQGPYYEVKYLFDDWSQSDAVCNALLGVATRTGTTTSRTSPHQHPLSPNLYCRSARVEGASPPVLNAAGLPQYSGAYTVRAVYRPPTWEGLYYASDDPFGFQQIDPTTPLLWCTQELDFDTTYEIVTRHSYTWASDGKAAGVPLKVQVGLTTMRLTFHRVPYMPTAVFRTYRGQVNNATFLGAAPYCVLFKGGTTRREVDSAGNINQAVGLTFVERSVPWWNQLRRDKIAWDTLTDGTGAKSFTAGNLSGVLSPFF